MFLLSMPEGNISFDKEQQFTRSIILEVIYLFPLKHYFGKIFRNI